MNAETSPASPPAARPPGRLAYLDGFRALAAMDVVLHHSLYTLFPIAEGDGPKGLLKALTLPLTSGHLAVTVFIVLSGYSLTLSVQRRGGFARGEIAPFLRRRLQRIYPAYVAALGVSLLLALTVLTHRGGNLWGDDALPIRAQDVVAHLLLLHDVFPPSIASSSAINYALWSVAVEFHLYLLFPLFVFVVRPKSALLVVGALCVVGVGIGTTIGDSSGVAILREAPLAGSFAIGIAAARLRDALPGPLERWWPRAWPVLLVGGFLVWLVVPLRDLTGAATFAVLLIALHRGQAQGVRRLLEARWLLLVGVMSYSLYVIHAPLLEAVWRGVMIPLGARSGDGAALLPMLVLGLGASLLAARVLFVLVERPTLPTSMRAAEARELAAAGADRPGRRG